MNFVQWCDDNNGFLTAILSLIGLILSVTAIVVSICTARLPYKKRIVLGYVVQASASIVPGVGVESLILGMSASATNVGNRTVNLRYLGYAVKKMENTINSTHFTVSLTVKRPLLLPKGLRDCFIPMN